MLVYKKNDNKKIAFPESSADFFVAYVWMNAFRNQTDKHTMRSQRTLLI